MGRLRPVGVGEVVDRLSILCLKLHKYPDRAHFNHERKELYSLLELLLDLDKETAAAFDHTIELAITNSILWRQVDEISALLSQPFEEIDSERFFQLIKDHFHQNAWRDQLIYLLSPQRGAEK